MTNPGAANENYPAQREASIAELELLRIASKLQKSQPQSRPLLLAGRVNDYIVELRSNDFGDLLASLKRPDEDRPHIFGNFDGDFWAPMTTDTDMGHLDTLVEVAKHAAWESIS